MAIDAQRKDDIFRHPTTGPHHLGRWASTCRVNGTTVVAIQEGVGRSTRVLLLVQDEGGRRFLELPLGLSSRPTLAVSPTDQLAVVWSEGTDDGWQIRTASISPVSPAVGPVTTVFSSDQLCLPPHAVFVGERLNITWSALVGETFRVHVAGRSERDWRVDCDCSPDGVNCFRPQLAAMGDRLLCAWDFYEAPAYHVSLNECSDGQWRSVKSLGGGGERWLCPRLIAEDKTAYLACLVVQDVIDELGIVDHATFAPVACYDGRNVTMLADPANDEDPRIVADLREGLLAGKIYKGHVGLRRNPQLALRDGELWCLWESREEGCDSSVVSRLVGRRYRAAEWSRAIILCDEGYCWSVGDRLSKDEASVGFLSFPESGRDVLQARRVSLKGPPLQVDTTKWNRWRPIALKPPRKPETESEFNGNAYRVFWVDTHVHSVFSPDAEGELDELVHFARDIAGLDAICIIDNDYYPHKALTEVEWRTHQAMAAAFTRTKQFVWLPGYEFTYHRSDIDPDFNHRCVIFPRMGPLLRRIDPFSDTDAKMIACLKETDGMAYPHHCSYALLDSRVEWNIEACSSWRVCLEETDFTIRQLQAGAKIGFVGSSDTHRMVPGLGGARTGLWARELTPEAIFDAFRNRRCLATQGRNVLIDFRINGRPIGSTCNVRHAPKIKVHVEAPIDIEWIELVRDGEPVLRVELPPVSADIDWRDDGLTKGPHFYFVRVKLFGDPSFNVDGGDPASDPCVPFTQDSRYPHNLARAEGPFAWSSPIWVNPGVD